MAGSRYEARFLVRNRGNVASPRFAFSGSTSRGTRSTRIRTSTTLAPGSSVIVTVRVAMAGTLARTTDDVLELAAVDQADASVRVIAIGTHHRRAAHSARRFRDDSGRCSRFGPSAVRPAWRPSRSRDRARWRTTARRSTSRSRHRSAGRRRTGSASATSIAPTSGTTGSRSSSATIPYGFYAAHHERHDGHRRRVQRHLRRLSRRRVRPAPALASRLGLRRRRDDRHRARLLAAALLRHCSERQSGGVGEGRKRWRPLRLSGAASLPARGRLQRQQPHERLRGACTLSREPPAASATTSASLHGASDFAGIARGTTCRTASCPRGSGSNSALAASGSIRESNFAMPLSGIPAQRFSTANLSASYGGLATLEYGWLSRRDDGALTSFDGTQHGLRATSSLPLGPASLSVSYEHGTVDSDARPSSRAVQRAFGLGPDQLWNAGTFSVFGAHDDGNTLTGCDERRGERRRRPATCACPSTSSWSSRRRRSARRSACSTAPAPGSASPTRASSIGSRADRRCRFAARIWQNPLLLGFTDARAIYLEFRTPLRLPIGPSHAAGRAEGRIVDGATGQPVAGALVRVGRPGRGHRQERARVLQRPRSGAAARVARCDGRRGRRDARRRRLHRHSRALVAAGDLRALGGPRRKRAAW